MGKLYQGTESHDRIDIRNTNFNVVWAKSGVDVVHAREDNDTVSGANDQDIIHGYGGDDFLMGEGGRDYIYAGQGNDTIHGGYANWVPGGKDDLADYIRGDEGDDALIGERGNDTLYGGSGNDYLDGGDDLDTIWGGSGNDSIFGRTSRITAYTNSPYNSLYGEDGDDYIRGGVDRDKIDGGNGNNEIWGGNGQDIINGGIGNDKIHGDEFIQVDVRLPVSQWKYYFIRTKDVINSGAGNDTIEGMGHDDVIDGGEGNDIIYGDYIKPIGTYVEDIYVYGDDYINGGLGDDVLYGNWGNDTLLSGEGTDILFGGKRNDVLRVTGDPTQQGINILFGGEGDDSIIGGDHSTPAENLLLPPFLEQELKNLKDFIKSLENANNFVPTIGEVIDGGRGFDTIEAGEGMDIIMAGLPTSANTQDKVQLIYGNSKESKIPEPDVFVITTVELSRQEQINQAMIADSLNLVLKGLKILVTIVDISQQTVPIGKIPGLVLDMGVYGVELWKFIDKYTGKRPDEPSILDKMTVIPDFDPGLDVLYLDNGGGKLRYTIEYKSQIIGNKIYQGLVFSDAQGKIPQPRVLLQGFTNRDMERIVRDENQILPTTGEFVGISFLPNLNSPDNSETSRQPSEPLNLGNSFTLTEDHDFVQIENSNPTEIITLAGNDTIIVDTQQRVLAGVGNDEIYAGVARGSNTLSGGMGEDAFWFYDEHGGEVINTVKNLLGDVDQIDWEVWQENVYQQYINTFGEATLNVVVDFNLEEDLIGFTDFLIPVGINNVSWRKQGNDSIISLFERDIILLQNTPTENVTSEHFVFDNSLFEKISDGDNILNTFSILDEEENLTDTDNNGFDDETLNIRLSSEELISKRKLIKIQEEEEFLSSTDTNIIVGTDDDDRIIVDGNQQVFALGRNDQIYASISSGGNILSGGTGNDEFWFYDDSDGDLVLNIVENVVTGGGSLNFDVIEEYGKSFQDGIVNTITDFNPEEDVIGVVDFPFPVGLNSFEFRQEGNDFIISLFERDIILLQNIREENLTTENFIFDNSLFDQILTNNLNNYTNEQVIVNVSSSADNIFPEDVIITSPQPDTSTVFIAGNQNHTFESGIAPDFFDLISGGANIIQGILPQLNEDIIDGFGENDQITIQNILLSAEQIKLSFAFDSTVLDIDADGDNNIDSSMTLEGDFGDTLFLVNQEENNTDITFKVLDTPIYRFQNKDVSGAYLFAGEEESQSIRENHTNFTEEGLAFKVTHQGDSLIRINRFQNKDILGAYLFASEEESKSIRENHTNFIEEGIAFYAASVGSSTGSGIYRFQSLVNPGAYIFVGEQERQNIIQSYSDIFVEEGIVFEVVA